MAVTVGEHTYGNVVTHFRDQADLKIGKFCSIAGGVHVFLGGEHRTDWITTFPFNIRMESEFAHIKGHPATKGDVVIGNAVWIGEGVYIMSGVTIGDGAVIGAMSVVRENVQPYDIVVGNPAKVHRSIVPIWDKRKLIEMAWWDWPLDKIKQAVPILMSNNVKELELFYERNVKNA